MKTTCLINSFNYRQYIEAAVDSALAQTVPFDQVVIVDDGSTDGSVAALREKYEHRSDVTIVAKSNQGQLSCFNEGLRVATGDIVFFLDADDVYEANYVEQVLNIYRRPESYDCVLAAFRPFGAIQKTRRQSREDQDLGYSVIETMCQHAWIGAPTSCLSMRRCLAERFLPIPYLDDWRVRADDCLVFGSSAAGGRKYFLAEPLVNYRLHANNHFTGKGYDKFKDYRHKLAVNRLMQWLVTRMGYDARRLTEFAHREFCTIDKPTMAKLWKYLQLAVRSQVPLSRKLGIAGTMLRHYCFASTRRQRNQSVAECELESRGCHPSKSAAAVRKQVETVPAVADTHLSKV
jgi:glycosyltransferase involved in cell wall biosynthesis